MSSLSNRKVVVLSGIGAVLEFYDFCLYMVFSKEISATFFSGIESELIKSIFTVIIFSIAYLIRPFAGMILGSIGDVIGRKKLFTFTIMLMGICSFLMGVLPGYETLGLTATVLFVTLRILQGVALGGELPAAYVIVYESVQKNFGAAFGLLFTFVTFGFLFSDLVSYVFGAIFGDYAWRMSFIFGGVLAFFGYYVRLNLHETPQFLNLQKKDKVPFLILFNKYSLRVVAATCLSIVIAFGGVMLTLYMHDFVGRLIDLPSSEISFILAPSLLALSIATYVFGYRADKIGLRKTYAIACVLLLILALPCFYIIANIKTPLAVIFGTSILTILFGMYVSVALYFICDLFPTDVRLSGVGLSYNLAFALVGGLAPLTSHSVGMVSGQAYLGFGAVALVCALLGLLGLFLYSKHLNKLYKSKII
ncbi:MFS transporter [Pseudofrancisella aestuarii]|uniref:MFS transporter n=1 Tax=Pseudofrancisella aestuarii TaxID=2670347 RepID=A0ABV9TCM0_9GAMM|nr:MFS transporter [Pseudofrancisella aestuarii]